MKDSRFKRSNIWENKDLIDQRDLSWEIRDLRDHLRDQEIGFIEDRLNSEGFLWLTDRQTDGRTFAIVESLSRLKIYQIEYSINIQNLWILCTQCSIESISNWVFMRKLNRCTYVLKHHKENGIIEYSM